MILSESLRRKVLDEVLKPSVRILAKDAIGSGTIIYSKDGQTYVLTNHHVIEKNIEYKQVWDNIIKKDVKRDFTSPVELNVGRYDDTGRYIASTSVLADIIAYSKEQDIALLKVRDNIQYNTAKLYPHEEAKNVPLLVPLCCCGAALGEKPVVTFGNLNGIQIEIDNYEFWLSSAPSVFGNSGGGVYVNENGTWKFLGIPSRISVVFIGFGGSAVTHMGYFIPAFRIYDWLDSVCYQFLYNPDYTPEQCDKLREEKKAKELAMYMRTKE